MAVILNDTTHKDWNEWDFKLFKAHYIIQDWYRDGIPIWWDESERVAFDAKARISKSRAAIERAEEASSKNKKSVPGRYFTVEPVVIGGGDFPTRQEWLEERANMESGNGKITKFGSDNPKNKVQQGR